MTIALAANRPRSSAAYLMVGSLPRNAAWAQTLEIPAIAGVAASISGNTDVLFIFRENKDDDASTLTVSVLGGEIVVTDGDTLTISVADLSTLTEDFYYVDLVSNLSSVTTLWASGLIGITNSLAS